jgi:hypothetical protein
MPNITEAEARLLLSSPLRCEGELAWATARNRPASLMLSIGILDGSGAATPMEVDLVYRSDTITATQFLFSIYIRRPYGRGRVYQLEVTHTLREIKDRHAQSHEHMGDRRFDGQAAWENWGYHEVLAYFCSRTNLTFDPSPPDPTNFWRARKP